MMKKMILSAFALFIVLLGTNLNAENVIRIKGHVKFNEPKFKMQILKNDGFDRKVIAEFDIDSNNNYNYSFKVEEPGVYTLDCKKWEAIQFWAEDEDVTINFRGVDTAKMKIKNPPYHAIENAGPKNKVINEYNFALYRNYQFMIALSQASYKAKFADDDIKEKFTKELYNMLDIDVNARIREIARSNYNINSVVCLMNHLKDGKDDQLIKMIVDAHPNYEPLKKILAAKAYAYAQQEKMKEGKYAPLFSFPTRDGKKSLGPADFKGKFLVIDFWASWCGPCRQETPHMKEIYPEYKKKGVEFLSVSIDGKRDAWEKALDEEQMAWSQVLAPDSGKELMKDYQFSGIPFIILLDRDGKIVSKHLRGKAIDKKLDEVLSGKPIDK